LGRKFSAGILLYRFRDGELQVLLAHPGGPYWARKDKGAWMIPKGEVEEGEDPLQTAKREFREEIGFEVDGRFIDLGEVKQSGGKRVHIWALEKDFEVRKVRSNTFTMEWPKGSGMIREFPEIDKARWFNIDEAYRKILRSQKPFLDRLVKVLNYDTLRERIKETSQKGKTLLDFLGGKKS